ncbi:MAG TPA: HPF/RaiA family ribosome-associated protein [Candidatus Paceibacterota bacterium]|nr:HPF/RaiA family ribosome-associated protein [Verrucomicrobiota bacterium]HRY46735.1 HPF/RaiA family ribosome-associated protein [Candidatus Paceibacterota bacterium]
MRINLKHLNLRSQDRLDHWIEEQILQLGESRQIDEANVRLECRSESSPPFSAHIHLVTPGPDLFAESSDHTMRAAFNKAFAHLRESISSRTGKRLRRLKSNLSSPAAKTRSSRWL